MIELWDEQLKMVADIRAAYRAKHRSVLLVSPTGSGKTVMFAYMTHNHVQRGGRVLILVHRQELIDQVCKTLEQFDQWHSCIAPGYLYDSTAPVQVASVFSLIRRLDKLHWKPTLIIVDEAHHAVGVTTWGKILARYTCHVLGVTATPIRLSGEGLGETFETMVLGPTTQQLIMAGRLAPFRVFGPPMDLQTFRTEALLTRATEQDSRRPKIIGSAVDHYKRLTEGRQAVAFCISVKDAENVAIDFREKGYQAASIDGAMPDQYRREMVRDFKSRTLKIMTSCSLVDEGFDCPGIEVDIDLAPTLSLGRHLQRRGRCLRTAPGKTEAIILDHSGNMLRHGFPTEDREWSLSGNKSSGKGERPKSVRVCPKCWAQMAIHHRACIQCGAPFEVIPRHIPKKDGDLEEITAEQAAALRYKETQRDKDSIEALTDLGRRRGYKNPEGWAKHVFDGRKAKKVHKVTT